MRSVVIVIMDGSLDGFEQAEKIRQLQAISVASPCCRGLKMPLDNNIPTVGMYKFISEQAESES